MVGINYHFSKSLRDPAAKRKVIPVAVGVSRLAHSIRDRISNKGKTADGGTFRPLVARRKGGRTLRRFYKSGQLWRSLTVSATQPDRIRVVFKGKRQDHGKKSALTNPQIAWLLQKQEPNQILKPSPAEADQLARDLATLAPGEWLRESPIEAGKLRAERREARAQKKIAQAKALRAQLRALGIRTEGIE